MTTELDPTLDPYLSGQYEPVTDERDDVGLAVRGELPAGLRGAYLRNGGNPQFAPLGRYHLFDGDGMVHAITIDDDGVSYRNRWILSAGLLAERRAGRALFGGLSEFVMPDPELAAEAGMVKNTANTNVIRHAGRILALMEGARPTELTAELDTVGEYDFDGSLVGPMTAHPRWDPRSGELHFFGYGPFPPYLRYHVADAAGRLVRSIEVPLERPVMMHDFVVTESSAVFFDLPALFDVEAMLAGGAAVRWAPEAGARIGVLPRDGGTATWIELDPCFVFHFVNAFDRPDGTIVVDGCRAPAMPTAFGDEAMPDGSVRPSLHRWEIDAAAGTVRETQLDDRPADFPRVADAVGGLPYRYGYLGHAATWDGTVRFDGVTKWDLEANSSATYVYGPHASAGEAVFAPDPAGDGEDAGWLLNFVTDLDTNTSRFVVLDARDVEAGPVAEVPLPRRVPFGFHGNWMADD